MPSTPRTKAAEQASRCSHAACPIARSHCPLHNNIPDWLRLTAEGRLRGGLRGQPGHQHLPRDLRPHLPAGPAVRRQLRDRAVRPRHRHHRRGREIHHRHRLGEGLGQADPPARWSATESVGDHRRGPRRAGRGRRAAPRRACRSRSMTAMTARGGLMTYGIPGFKLEKDVVMRRNDAARDGRRDLRAELRRGRGHLLRRDPRARMTR